MRALGTNDTTLLIRSKLLKFLDQDTRDIVRDNLKYHDVKVIQGTEIQKVEKINNNLKKVTLQNGDTVEVEMVLLTIGRVPNVENLNLEKIGVKLGKKNEILIDKFD